ncbi:unnamed protein product [Tilletia controversa]|uniref:Anaphase-promoting complex subunit 5 n=1 Tax=Tilletia controversa TaxID=13291 RepID=A0A8X7MK12_9BASI|nr:hypothetical protein CF328_g8269 [Tilletia controversa]KAE8238313.1 hypothetical protein A4X06_0g8873 [Tilletia controversa]CAD6910801.1 unnamed protein product [Tilletia controversa]
MAQLIGTSTSAALVPSLPAQAGSSALTPAPNGHADHHKIGKLTVADGMAAFGTAVTIFNELSDLTGVAGPFLKMGLGVVQEIISIVEQVKENKQACANFVVTALTLYHRFARAAELSGCPIWSGTSSAILIEPVLQQIQTAKSHIRAYAQLPRWKRFLKRDEIEKLVKAYTEDLDRGLATFTAEMILVQRIRADHAAVRLSASANSTTAPIPIITVVEEPDTIQGPSPAQSPDLLDSSLQQGLQQVSTAVTSEIKRKATLEDTQTAEVDADAQGTGSDQPKAHPQQPFTADEQQQMRELRETMQRLFLAGDSEDLEGIFHNNGADGDPIAEQGDPAQSALNLLDKLCSENDPSYSKQTLQHLRELSDNLGKLGLLDQAVMVLQLLTALCRRKVTSNGYVLDRVNLASALRYLSSSFLSVGRWDEALATSEEVISIIKPMADREPKRYNAHLARAMGLVSICQGYIGEHDAAMQSVVRALDIIRSLHQEQPAAFGADLAATLDNYSLSLSKAGRYEEALKAREAALAMYRSLHKALPAAFVADLARTLGNYSVCLGEAGRHEEALKTEEQSLAMRRALHRAQPTAFEAILAGTLGSYSKQLSKAGRYEEALKTEEESLAMYRSLHKTRPAAFESDLVTALYNYSVQLSKAERHEKALEAAEESLAMYRSLHERRSAAFKADLVWALNNYSIRLGKVGRHDEALKARQEWRSMK